MALSSRKIGYSNIWPLFGSANQLLSALVLITLCVFMKVTKRSNKMLFRPLSSCCASPSLRIVERLIAMGKAVQAGSATFMVEGLQIILAILLLALGVTIVVNSLKAYFTSRKGINKDSSAGVNAEKAVSQK